MTSELGKFLIVMGTLLALLGVVLLGNVSIPWLGKLPGDIVVKRENFSFYFPLATCILVSVALSLIFYLFRR